MGVVLVALRRARIPQAIAIVERECLAVADRQVALHVVAQARHGGPRPGFDHVDQAIARIEVVRTIAAADPGTAQVVQCVVLVQRIAEARRGHRTQPVQAVIGHVTVAGCARQAVGDGHHIATGIVIVAVIEHRGRSGGIAAALGQPTGILGQGMRDAVAL
ncbi:hypothetical protein G6F62_014414 [Rhizopus arrhizus]|nr:hypothetical protein G6F62_014414 [Rhizopus arrhizus]